MFEKLKEDIESIKLKDPAARSTLEIVFTYPGFHALSFHRLNHYLWRNNHKFLARLGSNISRFLTGIEIHPAAQIARRVFIDHGMGVVIGETAEVAEDVLIYQGVVLGGTSTNKGKRHPTVEKGAIIGAGAKVMGDITIGEYSKIGTGAVVLKDVPSDSTCVGVPGRIVKSKRPHEVDLDHNKLPDPVAEVIESILEHQRMIDKEIELLYDKNKICLTEDDKVKCPYEEVFKK